MDYICIRNLKVDTLVGVHPDERRERRKVKINIKLGCDLRKAGVSDDLSDTVNYKTIEEKVTAVISNNEYFLIERMAEVVAEICLETIGVEEVKVTVEKAGTLDYAKGASVEIQRPWAP